MLKYVPDMTTLALMEVPDEISIAFNISNCQNNCKGCFEAFLKDDIGEKLDELAIKKHLNSGVTNVLFMGEGNDKDTLMRLAGFVKGLGYKVSLYSGRPEVEDDIYETFDYVKVGPYVEEKGALQCKTTNQRLYHMVDGKKEDITYRFWK